VNKATGTADPRKDAAGTSGLLDPMPTGVPPRRSRSAATVAVEDAYAAADHPSADPQGAGSPGHLLSLVASGVATSRSELVRSTGLAASTVSSRIEALIDSGWVVEGGLELPRGGRRARSLSINSAAGYLLIADIGATHARVLATDLAGATLAEIERPVDLAQGPDQVADRIFAIGQELAADPAAAGRELRGAAVAIPGPVDHRTHRVVSPSRMPGWHDSPFGEVLSRRLSVPTVIENDANLMALGLLAGAPEPLNNLVVVKIGGGIGCGVITGGRLYRGASGVAGDISHNRVADAADRPCSCGNTGCLETIASGAALVKDLAATGAPVSSVAQILSLVQHNDAAATTAIRTAGRQIGEVLATMINFVNPEALFLAGHLSVAEPLVAAVRSVVYERCLPIATRSLTISAVQDRNLNIRAAAALVLQSIRAVAV